jgi:hypothetical protein
MTYEMPGRYQLWILNPAKQYVKLGTPFDAVNADLWLKVLTAHFGSEITMQPAEWAQVSGRTMGPGE